jgi:trimeric autotransporter adhesin
MKTMLNIPVVLLVIFVLCLPLFSQVNALPTDTKHGLSSPLVTAQASSDHIRFAALTIGSRMRLEIQSPTGETLYDSSFRAGNLIEWGFADQKGLRLSDGVFGYLITVEELSGRVTYRRGLLRLSDGKAALDAAPAYKVEAASVDSGEECISILSTDDRFPFTFVGHDGSDARIESTTGGLILHAGQLHAGESNQLPHMRLTPDGKLGIGVRDPQVKLDVAGLIRTSEGILFPDGSILRSAGGLGSFAMLSREDSGPMIGGYNSGSVLRAGLNGPSGSAKTEGGAKQMAASGEINRVNGLEGPDSTFYGQHAGQNNTGTWNSFFGHSAGYANTTGSGNVFFGNSAGYENVSGSNNAFYGMESGRHNTASNNAFFGFQAGYTNIAGYSNSFFGNSAGFYNTGSSNSMFGASAGTANTTGFANSFFGRDAGSANTTGYANSFFGRGAGQSITTEDQNSFFGYYADGAYGIVNATAIGFRAKVTSSNSLVLGSISGINAASADTNVGIGTTAPAGPLHVQEGSNTIFFAGWDGKIGMGLAAPERRLHVAETGTTSIRGVAFDQYSADQFASVFILRKSRSATPGVHTILQNGDALFNFTGQGSDGTKFVDVARIRMEVDGAPGVSDMPGRMTFWTTADGAASTTERMRIDSLGNVGIGTTSPAERLHVIGNIRATGSIFTQPGPETEIPDFVFDPGYKLMSVAELEKYLSIEKHLPNVPSAAEIKEKGLNLSDFQMKLLEKIEELTLYTVRQEKTIREQQARLAAIEKLLAQQQEK